MSEEENLEKRVSNETKASIKTWVLGTLVIILFITVASPYIFVLTRDQFKMTVDNVEVDIFHNQGQELLFLDMIVEGETWLNISELNPEKSYRFYYNNTFDSWDYDVYRRKTPITGYEAWIYHYERSSSSLSVGFTFTWSGSSYGYIQVHLWTDVDFYLLEVQNETETVIGSVFFHKI